MSAASRVHLSGGGTVDVDWPTSDFVAKLEELKTTEAWIAARKVYSGEKVLINLAHVSMVEELVVA